MQRNYHHRELTAHPFSVKQDFAGVNVSFETETAIEANIPAKERLLAAGESSTVDLPDTERDVVLYEVIVIRRGQSTVRARMKEMRRLPLLAVLEIEAANTKP